MALAHRFTAKKIVKNSYTSPLCWEFRKTLLNGQSFQATSVATLRLMRGEKFDYGKPFPYKRIPFVFPFTLTDVTYNRIHNENCKVISIEGLPGIGKQNFGQRLAKEFDLYFQPGIKNEHLYVNRYTLVDQRVMNEALPPTTRKLNFKELYDAEEMNYGRIERMQHQAMECRLVNYALGMLHLLSSGQGFVTVRTPYTDMVWVETMARMGWITPGFAEWQRQTMAPNKHLYEKKMIRRIDGKYLLRPHLHIYLHAPVDVVLDKIKKRQSEDPTYAGGRNLNRKFLEILHDRYMRFLDRDGAKYGEVLQIDWTEEANDSEFNEILDTIERTDLDGDRVYPMPKFDQWNTLHAERSAQLRKYVQLPDKYLIPAFNSTKPLASPEFRVYQELDLKMINAYRKHPLFLHYKNVYNTPLWKLILLPYGRSPATYTRN